MIISAHKLDWFKVKYNVGNQARQKKLIFILLFKERLARVDTPRITILPVSNPQVGVSAVQLWHTDGLRLFMGDTQTAHRTKIQFKDCLRTHARVYMSVCAKFLTKRPYATNI